MRCALNGVTVEYTRRTPDDRVEEPYQLYSADMHRCECGASVIVGFGKGPVADFNADPHRYAAFAYVAETLGELVTVPEKKR
jgi:hypothetical protein